MSKPVHTGIAGTVHMYDVEASTAGRPTLSAMSSSGGRGTHLLSLEAGRCELSVHDVTTAELVAMRDNLTAYLRACRAAERS
jgi:hypothetical protein